MIFDLILQPRKHRTNVDLKVAISPKKPFSSVMRYMVLWRHLWRYPINANVKTWYSQKPHIMTFTLIPSSFFSDHCVKLYGWMCITFQMPLVPLTLYIRSDTWSNGKRVCFIKRIVGGTNLTRFFPQFYYTKWNQQWYSPCQYPVSTSNDINLSVHMNFKKQSDLPYRSTS